MMNGLFVRMLRKAIGGKDVMATRFEKRTAPESLRLILLAYGIDHSYRVVGVEEIAQSVPHARRDEIREVLDRLAKEGLVTRFSGRYCFNKSIPPDLRHSIDELITPSGTIKKQAQL